MAQAVARVIATAAAWLSSSAALVQTGALIHRRQVAPALGSKREGEEDAARTRAISELYSSFKVGDASASLERYACIVQSSPHEKLPLQCYNGLLKALSLHGQSRRCEAVVADMLAAGVALTEASYSALLQAYVEAGDLGEAMRVLERMRREVDHDDLVPRLRTYAPLVRALCRARRSVEARALWREMTTEHEIEPSEDLFAEMLEALVVSADRADSEADEADMVESPVNYYVGELCAVLREMEQLVDALPSARLETIAAVVEKHDAGGRLRADFVHLSDDGSCPLTSVDRLTSPGLDASERRKVRRRLLDVAAAASQRQFEELDRFATWLDENPLRFTVVVDGPNVAYFNQNYDGGCFSVAQLKKVVHTLEQLGHIVLVIMPAKYCETVVPNHSKRRRKPRPMLPDSDEANSSDEDDEQHPPQLAHNTPRQTLSEGERLTLAEWAEGGALYPVPRGCHDDMYWMLATVAGDAPFAVTNDLIRDHWHKLVGARQRTRWARSKIVRFDISLARRNSDDEERDDVKETAATDMCVSDVHLAFPAPLARQIHRTSVPATGLVLPYAAWHIPDTEDSGRWLCLRVATDHTGALLEPATTYSTPKSSSAYMIF